MTSARLNPLVLKLEWKYTFDQPVYASSIASLIQHRSLQVLGCSFSRMMRVFDLKGKQIFQIPFSPEITQFMATSMMNENQVNIISGDNLGYVRMIDLQGNQIWKRKVGAHVISLDLGDVAGDSKKEIIVGLANNHVVLLNHLGEILFDFECSRSILDVTLGKLTDNAKQSMIVLFSTGEIASVDFDGKWTILITLMNQPTCLTFVEFSDTRGFLIGTKTGKLQLIDLTGEIYSETQCEEKINDVNKEMITTNDYKKLYIVVSSGSLLALFSVVFPKKISAIPTKNSFSQSFSAFPSGEPTSELTSSKSRLRCPECKEYLPASFKQKILEGNDLYCEYCGAKLSLPEYSKMGK